MSHNKFLLISIPRDLVAATSLIGILSIESSTDSDSVLSFYIEAINLSRIQNEFVSNQPFTD